MATHILKNLATFKAYEDKITAQIQEGKAILDQIEAQAKEKKAQAEIAAINRLQSARENISRKVEDLKKAHSSNVARAKADIDEAVATYRSAIDELGARFRTSPAKK